jgi:hypothetical protein
LRATGARAIAFSGLGAGIGKIAVCEARRRFKKRLEAARSVAGAKQAAEKLNQRRISQGFVTGHDFSRADKANQIDVGL